MNSTSGGPSMSLLLFRTPYLARACTIGHVIDINYDYTNYSKGIGLWMHLNLLKEGRSYFLLSSLCLHPCVSKIYYWAHQLPSKNNWQLLVLGKYVLNTEAIYKRSSRCLYKISDWEKLAEEREGKRNKGFQHPFGLVR